MPEKAAVENLSPLELYAEIWRVFVDTEKLFTIYKEWMAMTRPGTEWITQTALAGETFATD